MAKENQATLRIEWVRSGIAFNRRQKEIVCSLGLRRLHQVVERPDNPVVRGLIAKVSHLVAVREDPKLSVWASASEYTILTPEWASNATVRENGNGATATTDATPQANAEPTAEPGTEDQRSASETDDET